MRVVYLQHAISDLTDIAGYLQPRNPAAAADVGAAIKATVWRLARHPRSGRIQEDGSRKAVVLPFGDLAFYDAREASIEILAIRHGARDRPMQDA